MPCASKSQVKPPKKEIKPQRRKDAEIFSNLSLRTLRLSGLNQKYTLFSVNSPQQNASRPFRQRRVIQRQLWLHQRL